MDSCAASLRRIPYGITGLRRTSKKAFSLIETTAALIILAIVCSGVVVVINRCMVSTADSALRMQAFEVARENMEKLLASDAVKEMVEFGTSDKYPEIQWETIVEAFYEPITSRMWIRAVCAAEYTDIKGEPQTVELTHWLTNVTKEQLLQILARRRQDQWLAEQIIETVEEAAQYAGVDVETIEQWVEDGMPITEEGFFIAANLDFYKQSVIETVEEAAQYAGVDVETVQEWIGSGMVTTEGDSFIKTNLDLYKENNGAPPSSAISQQTASAPYSEALASKLTESASQGPDVASSEPGASTGQDWRNQVDPLTGLTYGELADMSLEETWDLLDSLGY
jgi:hypothetical protein